MGVIDWLQEWTSKKKVAATIKACVVRCRRLCKVRLLVSWGTASRPAELHQKWLSAVQLVHAARYGTKYPKLQS